MPKGRKRIPATGSLDLPYFNVGEIPWSDVEAVCGKNFPESDRREIHRCVWAYFANLSVETEATSAAYISELFQGLLHHAHGLVALAEKHLPGLGRPASEVDLEALRALDFGTTSDDADLSSSLRSAAQACSGIIRALEQNSVYAAVTQTDPKVVALAHFLAEAISGATRKRARASIGHQRTPTALEYWRWGLRLSAKSPVLADLASGVLPEPIGQDPLTGLTEWQAQEITQHQVQHAWSVARDLGLIPEE